MNILQISPQSYPVNTGGLETVVYNLAKNFKKLGHNVIVLTGTELPMEPKDIEGVHFFFYHYIPKPYFVKWFTSVVNQYKVQRRITQCNDIDLVVTHHPLSVIAAKELLLKKSNVYVFCSPLHEEIRTIIKHTKGIIRKSYIYTYYLYAKIVQKLAIKSSPNIASISDYMKVKIKEQHSAANVTTIPCGIDDEKFCLPDSRDKVREELNIPKDKKIVFTVRRMVPRMGIDMLVKAVKNNIDSFENTQFIIAGKGSLLKKYRKLVEKHDLTDYITFPGYLSEDNLIKHFQAADLYVQPTISLEGFGLTILEAMACGTPALITPIGASPEIISDFDKRFIADNIKPREFGKKVAEILDVVKNEQDIDKKCRDYATNKYSWDKMAREIINLVK